jgi:hypothetical protein
MTIDALAAMKFYQEIFGWQPSEALDMGPAGKYQMFSRLSVMIGGMMNEPSQMAHVPPKLADLFSCSRHQRGGRSHRSERKTNPERTHGSAWRGLDPERDRPAGGDILTAGRDSTIVDPLSGRSRDANAGEGSRLPAAPDCIGGSSHVARIVGGSTRLRRLSRVSVFRCLVERERPSLHILPHRVTPLALRP